MLVLQSLMMLLMLSMVTVRIADMLLIFLILVVVTDQASYFSSIKAQLRPPPDGAPSS